MKIEGYVICMPLHTWGDKSKSPWHPHTDTFGTTTTEAWIHFLRIRPDDSDWDRKQTHWIDLGYCVKKASMEVTW